METSGVNHNDISNMTKSEICDRIRMLNEEQYNIESEIREFRNKLCQIEWQEARNNRNRYIGRCYAVDKSNVPICKYIKYFKVIGHDDVNDARYAKCVVCIDGPGMSGMDTKLNVCRYGVLIMEVPVYKYVDDGSNMFVELCTEISDHTFNDVCREFVRNALVKA